MQWTDVKYGDEATPEQMNTVAHGVMAVEEWLNQIVGLPSMSGNAGKMIHITGKIYMRLSWHCQSGKIVKRFKGVVI